MIFLRKCFEIASFIQLLDLYKSYVWYPLADMAGMAKIYSPLCAVMVLKNVTVKEQM